MIALQKAVTHLRRQVQTLADASPPDLKNDLMAAVNQLRWAEYTARTVPPDPPAA